MVAMGSIGPGSTKSARGRERRAGSLRRADDCDTAQRSEGLLRLRPVLVFRHEARAGRFARLAHPDLAIGMQTGTAGGRNGGEPRAMQQSGVGIAAVRVDAAVCR